jgi:hypothetical protein
MSMREGFFADWGYLGALLAIQDSEEQAKFFEAFAKEVRAWPTAWAREMQMFEINKKLTVEAKDILRTIPYEGK